MRASLRSRGFVSLAGRIPAARRVHANSHRLEKLARAFSNMGLGQETLEHRKIVESISESVKGFHARGEKFRISHGSTNSTRNPKSKGVNLIDTSNLCHVLAVDETKLTALVEPNVPMDRLVEATLPHGLVPPVVMEFPGITAGGGYAGTSGESSSFRYGFFDRTINRAEIVLGSGEVVEASRDERADLLHGAAGAVGTLGVTTLLEIQLIRAKRFVKVTYQPVSSTREAVDAVQAAISSPHNDYVDGILFARDHGAIITGTLVDEVDENTVVQTFSRADDPWFYLHVQQKTEKAESAVQEVIPIAEYLFRYDRGGFWVGASAFKYFYTPFNRWTRWFLDDFMHTRMLYKALHASGHSARFLVQDLALPFNTAADFIDYAQERLGIYPLWLCPLKPSPSPTMHPHDLGEEKEDGLRHLLNVGVWGYGPRSRKDFVQANNELELKLRELGGMKWLYAHAYYTEDEFWGQFDRPWYNDLRAKYQAEALPNVYDKVRVSKEDEVAPPLRERVLDFWPLAGLYGLHRAIASKAYRQARESTWMHQR